MADTDSTSKKCSKCECIKLATEFDNKVASKDGLQSMCRPCAKSNRAVWRAANKGKEKATKAAYRVANPEKIKTWAIEHYVLNQEKLKAQSNAWRVANPEARRVMRQNRRSKEFGSGGRLSKGLVDKLFKLQKGQCACGCGERLSEGYHLDHIVPLSLNGPNEDANCQLLTPKCNTSKGAKCPIKWAQSRGFLL